ncbi:opioid growth factor receptor-like protein 1 [Engystomops pustulosus]|uniref:opioid growth factor receptor-like protein 1 n=1 Tax=Engystomops pustulosus TaxID=76066 RepID=UPI003AFB67E0
MLHRNPRSTAARNLQVDRDRYPQDQVRIRQLYSSPTLLDCCGGYNHEKNFSYSSDKTLNLTPNLDFYRNKQPFKPNGVYIDELLTYWKFDYERLERNHSYIQWLFPLKEPGRNSSAKPLTMDEIQIMKHDPEVRRRFYSAYKLMLNFYGITLLDSITGRVGRTGNWRERFKNLNMNSHNNLRITRILKCLGLMGFEHFQIPLVRFFLEETLLDKYLPNVKQSVLDHFIFTVKDKKELTELKYLISRYQSM